MSEVQPLIAGEGDDDVESGWDADIEPGRQEQSTTPIANGCTVDEMFEQHPHDTIRFLQTRGVQKLAEFDAEDDTVFRAFGDNQLLTFGSDVRHLDAEAEWRQRLTRHMKRSRTGGLRRGWAANQVAVEAFVVEIRGAAALGDAGILHPLVKQWQAKRCSYAVFALPAVQSVIYFKWTAFARRLLLAELALYCLWVGGYYCFTGAMQDEDLSLPLSALLQTPRGQFTVAAEAVALLSMCPFLVLEAGTVGAYGLGWLREPSNWLDLATYALQVAIAVMHLGRIWVASSLLTCALSVQCVLLMLRLQYFTQAFRHTRFSFPTMVREVMKDVAWVMVFILLVCVAFGAAVHITFRKDAHQPEEYTTLLRAVLSMFEHIYGDLELKKFINSRNPVFATALALTYIFVMGFVLVNMLIGVIINSLDRVLEHEGAKQLCNQARIIDELEAVLPAWYVAAHPRWHPRYVHVLRINPAKLDAVEKDKLWSRHGEFAPVMASRASGKDDGGDGGKEGGGGGAEVRELRRALREVQAQLHRQESLLLRLWDRLGVQAGVGATSDA